MRMIARTFATACLLASSVAASAQERVFDQGPVVAVSRVEVEPGQLRAYMADLNRIWRRQMEDGKARGEILSYAVYENMAPGETEPDLLLVTTYKNAAIMDTTLDELDQRTAKLMGSLDAANQAQAARGKLRTIKARELYRQLVFK